MCVCVCVCACVCVCNTQGSGDAHASDNNNGDDADHEDNTSVTLGFKLCDTLPGLGPVRDALTVDLATISVNTDEPKDTTRYEQSSTHTRYVQCSTVHTQYAQCCAHTCARAARVSAREWHLYGLVCVCVCVCVCVHRGAVHSILAAVGGERGSSVALLRPTLVPQIATSVPLGGVVGVWAVHYRR